LYCPEPIEDNYCKSGFFNIILLLPFGTEGNTLVFHTSRATNFPEKGKYYFVVSISTYLMLFLVISSDLGTWVCVVFKLEISRGDGYFN